jgi:hypothetical protein
MTVKNINQGKDIRDYRLEHWATLLKSWWSLHNSYCSFMEGEEGPHYFNERTNIGILASAAWRAGWYSLEEFGYKKRSKPRGKCDLYIHAKHKEQGEYIEAKQAWNVNISQVHLSKAVSAAKELKKGDEIRIGLLFHCPSIHPKYEQDINKLIGEIINNDLKVKSDAIAWVFPEPCRNLKGYDERIYPGILLLAKIAD